MSIQKLMKKMLFLFIIALLGSQSVAYAGQVNSSVKDWLDSEEQKKEENNLNEDTPTTDDPQEDINTSVGVTFFDFVKMIFATLFVIALLYTVLKFVNKKSKSYQTTQLIENLGGTSLGSNRSVQIVKVGNQILVVGVGESIQLLKEINDQEEYRKIIEAYNAKMEQLIQPSDIVTKLLEKTRIAQGKSEDKNRFANILQSQLKEFSNTRKNALNDMEKEGSDEK